MDRIENAYNKYQKATSFVSPQLYELDDEYLHSLLEDERSKDITNDILDIIKFKPHHIDETTNGIIAKLSNSFNSSAEAYDILRDSDMPFDDAIDSKGEHHKVSDAEYSKFIRSEDRILRKSGFDSIMNGFGRFNKTLAELFVSNLKQEKDFNELTNYPTSLEKRLLNEDVDISVFNNNRDIVNKYIPLLQEYVSLLGKSSGIKDFSYYDLFVEDKNTANYSIESAKGIILDVLKVLGTEYIDLVKKKLTDYSIDYLPNENKTSGGYCSNNYGCKTVILMNWTDDYNSLSTLIHEMGHCINAELFNLAQPIEKAGVTIFSAEMASTANEILLLLYMLKNSKNKTFFLRQFLDQVRSTIFRQTMFAEFELYVHNTIKNEQPLTYEDMNNYYYELNKKYYGDSCILPENLKYEWSRIPHFYNSFYVYSYSTGLITAINIVSRILKDPTFVDKYLVFLKNGTNRPAIEILKEIGIDLTTSAPFEEAFEFIKDILSQYKNEVNKTK